MLTTTAEGNEEEAEYDDEDAMSMSASSDSAFSTSDDAEQPSRIPARTAYHSRLLTSYQRTQILIARAQPPSLPVEIPRQTRNAWLEYIRSKDPTPALLASLSMQDAYTALAALKLALKWHDLISECGKRLQTWCWSILARLDAGSMGFEDAGRVRELGKKALFCLDKSATARRRASGGSSQPPSEPPVKHNSGSIAEHTSKPSVDQTSEVPTEPANGAIPTFAQGLAHDFLNRREHQVWLSSLTPTERKVRDMRDALIRAETHINSLGHPLTCLLVMKWAAASEGLLELCEKLHAVHGDVLKLGEDDQMAWRVTCETAVEEAEKRGVDALEGGGQQVEDGEESAVEDGEVSESDGEVEDVAAQRLKSAYATLDMIMTVVGEFFGQRDLLEETGGDVCWQQL